MAERKMNETRALIAKRVAKEFKEGDFVNLGAGMPGAVPDFMPEGKEVFFHNEGGVIGYGKPIDPDKRRPGEKDSSGKYVSSMDGGAWFDSFHSFCLMRGGHLDYTLLGTLEIDAEGSIASWVIPDKIVFGMGGAMDLVVGAKKVIVLTEHVTDKGYPKVVDKLKFPITAYRKADMIVTDKAVFDVLPDGGGLVLKEIDENMTVDELRAITGASFTVSPDLKNIDRD